MSTKRHFGPARGFCAAGIILLLGSVAQADQLVPDGDKPDDGSALVVISVDDQGFEDPGIFVPDDGYVSGDGSEEPEEYLVDGGLPDMNFDDDCIDCVYPTTVTSEAVDMETPVPGILSEPRDPPVRVAARAPRNICTEADLYVAWLCTWQGYARP